MLAARPGPGSTPGPSSRPPLAEAANSHAGRGPNNRAAAAAASPRTSRASPNTEPVGVVAATAAFQGVEQPGEHHPHALRAPQPNRRSQPRTVLTAGPTAPRPGGAPDRPPSRAARTDHQHRVRPAHKHDAGSSTCVRRHREHDERRGRRRPDRVLVSHASPPGIAPRPQLTGAHPDSAAHHQPGPGRPRPGPYLPSAPGASKHQATALPSGQDSGRAAALPRRRHALVANEEGQPTGPPFRTSSVSTTSTRLHVLSHGVAQQRVLPQAT